MSKSNNKRSQQQASFHYQNQAQNATNMNMSLSQGQGQNIAGMNDQENLKSYISDLKKAAIGNKKSRGNASQSRSNIQLT